MLRPGKEGLSISSVRIIFSFSVCSFQSFPFNNCFPPCASASDTSLSIFYSQPIFFNMFFPTYRFYCRSHPTYLSNLSLLTIFDLIPFNLFFKFSPSNCNFTFFSSRCSIQFLFNLSLSPFLYNLTTFNLFSTCPFQPILLCLLLYFSVILFQPIYVSFRYYFALPFLNFILTGFISSFLSICLYWKINVSISTSCVLCQYNLFVCMYLINFNVLLDSHNWKRTKVQVHFVFTICHS
jgi:hypothetical protein